MAKHFIFVAPDRKDVQSLIDWSVAWLDENRPDEIPDIYLITSIDTAIRAVRQPVVSGELPQMIVVDHRLDPARIPEFVEGLRRCYPECWTVELSERSAGVPLPNATVLFHPVGKDEWLDQVRYSFDEAASPQWSKVLLDEI
ncbi:MAG: hypothetical protein J6Y56_00400 [Fibrobacterales bacterium]|nr:hypothetical protein [Fibrobacterales bacterium]MBP5350402.1 hypothetical protein [Fibrobacterales bacterium]